MFLRRPLHPEACGLAFLFGKRPSFTRGAHLRVFLIVVGRFEVAVRDVKEDHPEVAVRLLGHGVVHPGEDLILSLSEDVEHTVCLVKIRPAERVPEELALNVVGVLVGAGGESSERDQEVGNGRDVELAPGVFRPLQVIELGLEAQVVEHGLDDVVAVSKHPRRDVFHHARHRQKFAASFGLPGSLRQFGLSVFGSKLLKRVRVVSLQILEMTKLLANDADDL